jgi:hypothetical protein
MMMGGKIGLLVGALGIVVAASGAKADTPPAKYSYYCVTKQGDDLARCRRCVDEALDPSKPPVYANQGGRQVPALEGTRVMACTSRLTREQTEQAALVQTVEAMNFEAASDADLDTMPETARPTLVRLLDVTSDLENKPLTDAEKAAKVDGAVSKLWTAVATEKACRTNAKCMEKRREKAFLHDVVEPMCQADQEREDAVKSIARENANPSGYVDKVLLHNLGATAQDAQDRVTAMTPAYVKVRKHPWRGWRSECVMPDAGAP